MKEGQIYQIEENGKTKWVLLIEKQSSKQCLVADVVSEKENKTCIKSHKIGKYIKTESIRYINWSISYKPIFIGNKPLIIKEKELSKSIVNKIKKTILTRLDESLTFDIEGIKYAKWCYDKNEINKSEGKNNIKQFSIHWIDFGYGVGSELRKQRPAVVWRKSGNNITVIPLSSSANDKKFYFHCKLENGLGVVKLESMSNISFKRVVKPYLNKGVVPFITKNDKKKINDTIKKYYVIK